MFKALVFFVYSAAAIAAVGSTVANALAEPSNAAYAGTIARNSSLHDFAVVHIETLRWVDVTAENPSATALVSVGIQNRSDHDERIDDNIHLGDGVTTGLIRLKVAVIDDDNEGCEPAKVILRKRAPLAGGPKFLVRPKQVYGIDFQVTYRCVSPKPRNRKDPTPWDYSHSATVHHEVLDGNPDTDPSDDICPRQPIPPKREIQDRGCGWGLRGQPLGPEVVDVVLKQEGRP